MLTQYMSHFCDKTRDHAIIACIVIGRFIKLIDRHDYALQLEVAHG